MNRQKCLALGRLMVSAALTGLSLGDCAGGEPWAAQKPAWLTDLSLSTKGTYDDNVLLVSGAGHMPIQPSLVTAAAGKFGFNFAPLLGGNSPFQALSLVYVPEADFYHNAPDESYDVHRVNDLIKGRTGDFSYSLDNAFTYVDGSATAPTYAGNDKYRSGFASVVPKERRKQIQERSKVVFQFDWDACFIRPTASVLYYDMMTILSPADGYQNYPSRADVNGGADFGYRVAKDLAVTLGYRYGHQYQQPLAYAIDSTRAASGSDYQRVLAGVEGKPWHWLTLNAQAGPDFRRYDSTALMSDKNDVTYYAEASATAELTGRDSLSLKYKQWRWVAYTGRAPYFDSNYELAYRRQLTRHLAFDLAGRIATYDFTFMSDPAKSCNLRNDYLYSIAPGMTFAVTDNLSVTAGGVIDFARNAQDNAPGGAGVREFDHNLASLGATYKF